MPAGLVDDLTAAEFAALVDYVVSLNRCTENDRELLPHPEPWSTSCEIILRLDTTPKSYLSNALHHLLARIRPALVKVGDFPRGDAQPPLDRHGIPAIPMAKGMVAG